MQVIKPKKLSVLHKTYLHAGKKYLVVTPMMFFKLGRSDVLFNEQQGWTDLILPPGMVFDFAMPKPSAEALVVGNAYAPNSAPAGSMAVRVQVGEIDKRINVIGDRSLINDRESDAAPFLKMPLSHEHAFGGPGFSENPVGKGLESDANGIALPNLEYSEYPYRSDAGAECIACFAPIDITAPRRTCYAGTYDDDWVTHDHPGLARDIDWRLFNQAPEDQRIDGFFSGGETYLLEGVAEENPVITGALPEFRTRCFLKKTPDMGSHFIGIDTVIDTVWFLPEKNMGLLLYRCQVEITDSDALDVESLLIAYERVAEVPREDDYYKHVLRLRTDPETALAHVFNDAQLSPRQTVAEFMEARDGARKQQIEDQEKAEAVVDATLAEVYQRLGVEDATMFKPDDPALEPFPVISKQSLAQGDFDLSSVLEAANRKIEEAKQLGKDKLEELNRKIPKWQRDVFAETNRESATEAVRRAQDVVLAGVPRVSEGASNASSVAQDDALATAYSLSRKGRGLMLIPEPEHVRPEVKPTLRGFVESILAEGGSLAGRDLSGVDLSGMDLAGADLAQTMLEHADLRGTNLRGANLDGAVLAGAILDGADLGGANMTKSSLAAASGVGVNARKVNLTDANLANCEFIDCDFSHTELDKTKALDSVFIGCGFNDCGMRQAMWINAVLDRSDWRDSRFERSMFIDCGLHGGSFAGARLERCIFTNMRAEGVDFSAARMQAVQIAGQSDLAFSDFTGAQLQKCGLRKANLLASDLSGALLKQCDLGEVVLRGADLTGTILYQSILQGTDLSWAKLVDADLFEAQLKNTKFRNADMINANLFGALIADCVFDNAVLDGVRLQNDWVVNQ